MATALESGMRKYLVVPGLTLTSALTITLIYRDAANKNNSDGFYEFVTGHRASTQLIVQILSHLLGAILVLTLTTLINFRTRLLLSHNPVSLHQLTWWNQLCNQRLNFDLPWAFAIGLLVFYAITLIPAALWAGAITPLATTAKVSAFTNVPKYTPDPNGLHWNQTKTNWETGAANTTTNSWGDFSFFPAFPYGGRALSSASSATAINNATNQTHAKYDKTRYSFSGRSYGVGASVGIQPTNLLPQGLSNNNVESMEKLARYSFEEIGYKSQVSCIKNHTSLWRLDLMYWTNVAGIPILWVAHGPLPNSEEGTNQYEKGYYSTIYQNQPLNDLAQFGYVSDSANTAIGSLSAYGRNILAIASNTTVLGPSTLAPPLRYWFLDQTQCDVIFTPRVFSVAADTDSRLINVTDVGPTADFDPSVKDHGFASGFGTIVQMALRQTMVLSAYFSTLFSSAVGDAFATNVGNEYQRLGRPINNYSDEAVNLRGIEHAFESILDDMLLGLSSAQLMLTDGVGVDVVPAHATVHAVRIGQRGYIYAVAAFNFVILGLYAFEALHTEGWKLLSKFNYNSLASVVVATSVGGREVGKQAIGGRNRWNADPQDAGAGRANIRLLHGESGVVLMAASTNRPDLRRVVSDGSELVAPSDSISLRVWPKSSTQYVPLSGTYS